MAVTAVFGGTFNPFHIGHYEMLSSLCAQDWISRVLVVPDRVPPHKECDFLASDGDRVEMCRLACEDFEKAELCLTDLEREGRSYTVDTIAELKKRYPEACLAFVCGGDMIATLDTWHEWRRLFEEVSFIAFDRGGVLSKSAERMRSRGAEINVLDVRITNVSSSALRKNLDPALIPEKIYNYIVKRKIYNG